MPSARWQAGRQADTVYLHTMDSIAGGAIYYSKKNNEEAIRIGVSDEEGIPYSDLFATAVYQHGILCNALGFYADGGGRTAYGVFCTCRGAYRTAFFICRPGTIRLTGR